MTEKAVLSLQFASTRPGIPPLVDLGVREYGVGVVLVHNLLPRSQSDGLL
jgi:hypothetical protein